MGNPARLHFRDWRSAMAIIQALGASILAIGLLGPSAASAQERVVISSINLPRFIGSPSEAVRGNLLKPEWVVAPNPQWPAGAGDISVPVTVISECSVSKGGSLRGCRIVGESIPDRGFGPAFLRALSDARVGASSYQADGIVFRTSATFDPPSTAVGLTD